MSSDSSRFLNTYSVRLSPRAAQQLEELPGSIAAAVEARLTRLALRGAVRNDGTVRVVQGQVLGKLFRALYEVDHDEGSVTVLDVAPRSLGG